MNKNTIIAAIVLLAVGVGIGRFMTPDKIKIETKIVEVEKKTTDKKEELEKKITQVKNKDGTVTTVTEIKKKTDTNTVSDKNKSTEENKEIDNSKNRLNIGVLAGLDITNPAGGYLFGAHVSKQLLGPFTIGIWGLSNKTAGVSVGIQY